MTDLVPETRPAPVPETATSSAAAGRGRLRGDAAWLAGAALASLLLAGWALQLWNMLIHIPLVPGGDVPLGILLIKTLQSHAWLMTNSDVGYPFGSASYDFAANYSDFTQLLILKAMTLVVSDPAAIINGFYILTFPLVTATSFIVLRALGFGRAVSATCAVIYSLLPFHFLRGETHLFLSAYYAVPVACWIVLGVLGRVRLVARDPARGVGWRAWVTRTSVVGFAATVFVGASEAYFAIFTTALALLLGLAVAFADRSPRRLVLPVLVAGTLLATVAATQAPTILWHHRHGANPTIAEREPNESELYGLKLANLVLPLPDSRIRPLRELSQKYYSRTILSGEGSSAALGLLMTIGLLFAVACAAAAAMGRRSPENELVAASGLAATAAFIVGTVGGGSAIASYLLSPQIRAWNRISPLIAFFALIALATLLARAGDRLQGRRYGSVVAGAGIAGVLIVAAIDQTGTTTRPQYDLAATIWRSDARFVRAIEERLPDGAPVLQLPYVPFPENPPVNAMGDYDHLKGYTHSTSLRWSYAAMKGRQPDDWGASMFELPTAEMVIAAIGTGFQAIWVDTAAYPDRGADLLSRLENVVGEPPALRSDNGRLVLFDLRAMMQRLERRSTAVERRLAGLSLVRPIHPIYGEGFHGEESGPPASAGGAPDPSAPAPDRWHWGTRRAVLGLPNTGGVPRPVTLTATLATAGARPGHVTVRIPGREPVTVTTQPARETPLRLRFVLPLHGVDIRFITDAPDDGSDPRDLRMKVQNLEVVDRSTAELVRDNREALR